MRIPEGVLPREETEAPTRITLRSLLFGLSASSSLSVAPVEEAPGANTSDSTPASDEPLDFGDLGVCGEFGLLYLGVCMLMPSLPSLPASLSPLCEVYKAWACAMSTGSEARP